MKNRLLTTLALAFFALTSGHVASALAAESTNVTVPIGSWINELAPVVLDLALAAVGAGLTFIMAKLPLPIVGVLKAMQVEKLLDSAVSYGINQVAGATHDKTLSVPTGNAVMAAAAGFVVAHAPDWAKDALGTPAQIEQKVLAKLKLDPAAGKPA